MLNKTLFCVSTANSELFKDNYRNSFTNHVPQFIDKSYNYKMSLGSIHLEKSFRTIGRDDVLFLLIHIDYNYLKSKYQDESDFIPNTIHDHFLHKFTINRNDFSDTQSPEQPTTIVSYTHMAEIVIILKPGKYKNTYELINTINNDLNQLGVDKHISFKQSEEENKLTLTINKAISRCVISLKLMEILGFNVHKTQRTIFQMKDITSRDLSKIAYYIFHKIPKNTKQTIGLDLMTEKVYEVTNKLLQQNTYLPSLIKIYCSQLNEKIESSNYSRLLCVCPGIDINDGNTYEYQPLTEHFSDIAVSDLEKLDFELRDEKGSLLEMDIGAATYIRLKIHQNNDDLKMNTINIFSNDKKSKELYPYNTNTNFTIQLPTTLLQGSAKRWTIKLTSLSMPKADISVTKEFGFIKVKVFDKIEGLSNPYKNNALCASCTILFKESQHDLLRCEEITANCKQEKHLRSYPEKLDRDYQIIIPPKDYKSITEFQQALGWSILDQAIVEWPSTYNSGILPAGIDFQQNGDRRYLSMFNNFATKEVSFGFPITLAYILGIKNDVQIAQEKNSVSNLTPTWFSNDFSNEYVWVHVKPDSIVKFPYLPDLNAGKARHAKIQCSEVKSTIFAGKHENLLAFYSLQSGSKSRDVYYYEFTHPLEVELNSQHIDSLNFKITPENSNNDISFASKKTPVFMSLIITKYD